MDGYLKQSTAAQTRWIGPFVDDVDFKTAETGLTIANTDIKVSKNGGASASKNSGGGTHDVNGMYAVTWDATDTATVGELKYSVKVAGALQVFGGYTVLEEEVYDDLFAAAAVGYLKPTTGGRDLDVSAGGEAGVDWANVGSPTTAVDLSGTNIKTNQKVDLETIKTQAVTAAAGVTFPTSIASPTNITAGTITTATNVTTVNGLAANVITATSINADAITDAKVAADVTIASVTGAVGSVTGAVGSVTGAVGSVTGNVGGNVTGSVGSVVGAVGSVTGNVGGNVVGSVASVVAAVAITSNVKKNQALAAFEFVMADSTNHNPATGKVVTVTRSINGGAFAAGTLSAVTEISNGIYSVDFGAGDLNGNVIVLRATAAACDDTFERIVTQP